MQKRQYRTASRVALIEYLKGTAEGAPQSAEQICAGLSQTKPAPACSSVYRMLSELTATGAVRKFRDAARTEGYLYQYVGDEGGCDGHFHLHCLCCGKVAHLRCGCGEEIRARLLATHGFAVEIGATVLYGKCADCAKGGSEHA